MEKENTIIKNVGGTCCNCLKETEVNHIHISAMGYGSGFDGWSTEIDLCVDCLKLTNPDWWKFEEVPLEESGTWSECFEYKYEDKIFEFVKQMPFAGQELFWNKYSTDGHTMESQDWIDFQLDILPHEKCKEYHRYSPEEVNAYHDRFPNCKHVQINVYSDGSKGSSCFKSAFGDGKCGLNISNNCYLCDCFEERNEEIEVVDMLEDYYKRESERLHNMIKYATKRLDTIKN